MLIPPIDAIETSSGVKVLRGKYWVYYNKSICTNCNKPTYQCQQNLLKSAGKSFCSKACQSIHRHKNVDPIGASILDKINTPEFTYLIGLLATDGHITYPPNYVHYSCEIGLIDLELIERLKSNFGGRIQRDSIFHWKLNNIEFVEYLKSIGFTHNKSYDLNVDKWFDTLTDTLKAHFIRGVFDGDGSICKNYQNLWRISITSASYDFITMIHNHFVLGNIYCDKTGCYSYQISNKTDIDLFLDIIYDSSSLHLVRKHQLYKQFKNE